MSAPMRPAFQNEQEIHLRHLLGDRVFSKCIGTLGGIVANARQGTYGGYADYPPEGAKDLIQFSAACRKFADLYEAQDPRTIEMLDNYFGKPFWSKLAELGGLFRPKKRARGGQRKSKLELIAADVGAALYIHVPLSTSREGVYACVLKEVFDAAGLDAPDDLFRLIRRVLPRVEGVWWTYSMG